MFGIWSNRSSKNESDAKMQAAKDWYIKSLGYIPSGIIEEERKMGLQRLQSTGDISIIADGAWHYTSVINRVGVTAHGVCLAVFMQDIPQHTTIRFRAFMDNDPMREAIVTRMYPFISGPHFVNVWLTANKGFVYKMDPVTSGEITVTIFNELKKEEKKMGQREESRSITHLVKIVAEEVCHKLLGEHYTAWHTNDGKVVEKVMAKHYEKCHMHQPNSLEQLGRMGNEFCATIKSTLEKAGRPWSNEEDALLVQEIKTAVAQAAVNHQRSRGSIRARIEDKELMNRHF